MVDFNPKINWTDRALKAHRKYAESKAEVEKLKSAKMPIPIKVSRITMFGINAEIRYESELTKRGFIFLSTV